VTGRDVDVVRLDCAMASPALTRRPLPRMLVRANKPGRSSSPARDGDEYDADTTQLLRRSLESARRKGVRIQPPLTPAADYSLAPFLTSAPSLWIRVGSLPSSDLYLRVGTESWSRTQRGARSLIGVGTTAVSDDEPIAGETVGRRSPRCGWTDNFGLVDVNHAGLAGLMMFPGVVRQLEGTTPAPVTWDRVPGFQRRRRDVRGRVGVESRGSSGLVTFGL
jgi:hypothetical protein